MSRGDDVTNWIHTMHMYVRKIVVQMCAPQVHQWESMNIAYTHFRLEGMPHFHQLVASLKFQLVSSLSHPLYSLG